AMSHDNLLDSGLLFDEIKQAIDALLNGPDVEACRKHLETAAARLLAAREILYPVTIHLVDLTLITAQTVQQPLPAAVALGTPTNVIVSALMLEALENMQPERFARLKERITEDNAEILSGPYVEREDDLLPIESQLWNLTTGLSIVEEIIGRPVRVYAR